MYRQIKNCVVILTSKQKVVNLSSGCRVHSNLYPASQAREGDLNDLFAHGNHAFLVSISECGKLRAAKNKSEFTQLLHKIFEP